VGTALFSHYVLAFQLVGVLLLTGIVGAVSLAQRGGGVRGERRLQESPAETELSHG